MEMLWQQGLVFMPRSFPFQHLPAPLVAALPPRAASTHPLRAQRLPCPCPGRAAARGRAASTELCAGQGTQLKPEPSHLRALRLPSLGSRPLSSPSAELETLTAPLLQHVHPQQGQSSRSRCSHSQEPSRLSPCKTSHASRRVKCGFLQAELHQRRSGCSTASPAPSKAISKQLYPSWWLRRCAPASQPSSARAKPVSGTGLWSIISLSCSEQSHVPAFPRPAIFRLSLRCLRCFANSGRALLPDDVKLMQFSQL